MNLRNYFTKEESNVILFLLVSFVVGFGVYIYRHKVQDPPLLTEFHDNGYDSVFTKLSAEPSLMVDKHLEKKTKSKKTQREFIGKISINHAKESELELIPSVGPVTAERIITYRREHGSFQSVDELIKIKGIGKKTGIS